ncbi:thiol:disulfide interchange protein DsbA/DsbL [Oleiagrimonas sp. C23AA]|uniref:thiol:disulfide interchange protein DsbA/DsbL n=1 Tax=Oleiagrimonas sp. C23AA TaxID=2719047 RepID=UPI00141E5B6F|nr:thiol:disulfide interchange protein DsbA/DsbL [Oleiagrimonas sp. C23AA]NII11399.1 thiol:disulfide interchange protein DsbA/DsbL [Oleiagrimonas sp. C23AA]
MFKRIALLMLCLVATSACAAADSNAPYTQGQQYFKIDHPERVSPKGKVEVVEVFSYGCIHCDMFAPDVEKLRKSLPKGVSFHFVPANFSPAWEPYARAFYAARELGVLDKTHMALFHAKFDQHYPLNSLDDLADFYAREGVDRAKFMAAANSVRTDALLKRDDKLVRDWGVNGTPTMIINGKYRTAALEPDDLLKLTRWLIQRELKAKAGG